MPMMNTQLAKARSVIHMIKNNLKTRDEQSLLQLYRSHFQSRLLYASEVWMNIEEATINKLNEIDCKFWSLLPEGVQRPVCLSSAQIAIKKNLIMYFKSKHNLAKLSLDNNFTYVNDEANTRSSLRKDFLMPKCRLAFVKKEFVPVTTKLLNQMDAKKRETKLLSIFYREAERIALTYE